MALGNAFCTVAGVYIIVEALLHVPHNLVSMSLKYWWKENQKIAIGILEMCPASSETIPLKILVKSLY